MANVSYRLLVLLLLAAGVIVLQILFSRSESKWPGLIFPICSFCWSLLYPLNMAAVGEMGVSTILQLLLVWALANIPTYLLLGIYFACRGRKRDRRQREKMKIQDLE